MDKAAFPQEILEDLLWSFVDAPFEDQSAFSEEVRQYQIDITGEDSWQPDLLVLPVPHIQIAYEYWGEDGDQVEDVIELNSRSGGPFTALDLMFQLHNAVVGKLCDDDHHFFEGLTLDTPQASGDAPSYLLNLGS